MANARTRSQSTFGAMPRDGARNSINTSNGFVTADATASPILSPLSYVSGTTDLKVPANAVSLVIQSTVALKVSELANQANSYLVAIGAVETFACAGMSDIYISAASAATIQFRFNYI